MAIEHPSPIITTIKYLYAHAFGCAFEGCKRPLYRIDPETGQRTLASRVAHICARREGGARWNSSQSATENRSENNLILMCIEHASIIDDPALVDKFNVSVLNKLKSAQLQEYDEVRQGWTLTNGMAAGVAEKSFSKCQIDLGQNNVIHLGGQGGQAPGAGGGGGGAIGAGSKGGDGGDGGSARIDNSQYSLPYQGRLDYVWPTNIDSSPSSELPPGAGGGGAGGLEEGDIPGNGGDGGNLVSGTYDLEAMRRDGFCDRIELAIVDGEVPYRQDESLRERRDAVIRFLRSDGSILKEVRAEGGLSGALSLNDSLEAWIELSPQQVRDTNFRVTTLMVANACEIHSGNLFIQSGDWRYIDVPSIPFRTNLTVVVSFRFDFLVGSDPTVVFLSWFEPSGREVARVPIVLRPEVCRAGMLNHTLITCVDLKTAGDWHLRVWSGVQVFSSILVEVRNRSR